MVVIEGCEFSGGGEIISGMAGCDVSVRSVLVLTPLKYENGFIPVEICLFSTK